jgi:hypothetical protein
MSETYRPRRIGRSIGALFAGFLAVIILSIGTDMAMRAAGFFPPLGQPMSDALFLMALAYRTIYGVVGSYIVARLAPYRPMYHALLSGVVGLVLSIVGAAATWSKGPEFGPKWYPLALVVTAIPCAWAGGKLHLTRRTRHHSPVQPYS